MSESNGKGITKRPPCWKDFRLVEEHASKIEEWQAHQRRADARVTLEIGRELVAAQKKLAHCGDGEFGRWRRDRLQFSDTQARRYMAVYRTFGDCANLVQSFDLSALYVLASKGTPKEAIEEALALANNGGKVTHMRAQVFIEDVLRRQPSISGWDEEEENGGQSVWRKQKPTALKCLKKWWLRATLEERRKFKSWVKERQVRTDIDTATGQRRLVKGIPAVGAVGD